jgi:hypothetical protein
MWRGEKGEQQVMLQSCFWLTIYSLTGLGLSDSRSEYLLLALGFLVSPHF